MPSFDSSPQRTIRIAVLECLRLPNNVAKVRGQFGHVFRSWLENALKTYPGQNSHELNLKFSSWDVEHGQYPPSLDEIDALIVTGSTASAYDTDPWILELGKYLKDTYHNNPDVRLFGGCFGHQLLCHTLLPAPQGMTSVVKKSPQGWEIGVHDVTLNQPFIDHFPKLLSGVTTMASQFLHADHVVLPSKADLPRGWMSIGSSPLCQVQGSFEPGRVLAFQGHPEFDEYLNSEAVKNLGKSGTLSEGQTEEALRLIRRKDDAVLYGHILLEFLTSS